MSSTIKSYWKWKIFKWDLRRCGECSNFASVLLLLLFSPEIAGVCLNQQAHRRWWNNDGFSIRSKASQALRGHLETIHRYRRSGNEMTRAISKAPVKSTASVDTSSNRMRPSPRLACKSKSNDRKWWIGHVVNAKRIKFPLKLKSEKSNIEQLQTED